MLRTNELEGQTNTINTNSITLLVEIFSLVISDFWTFLSTKNCH